MIDFLLYANKVAVDVHTKDIVPVLYLEFPEEKEVE